MKILFKVIIIFFSFTAISNANLIKPNIYLNPFDIITIQLKSLQNNNIPYKDFGIEQVWEFAHPINKKSTGPLEKFKQMIYSDSYKMLIEHENNNITILNKSNNKFVYKVYILSKSKKKYFYIWQIEKVLFEGKLKNCWMTTSVSPPEFLGNII